MAQVNQERQSELLHRARILKEAGDLYQKAAAADTSGQPDEVRFRYIKTAKEMVEEAFPEVFAPRHPPAPRFIIKEESDHRVAKILGVAAIILGVLYALVAYGPTGDLSKTWVLENLNKNTAYPKQER